MVGRFRHVCFRLCRMGLVVAAGAAAVTAASAKNDGAAIDLHAIELDNGVTILIAPDDAEPGRVTVGVFARAGAAADGSRTGLAAFTGRLLFQPGLDGSSRTDPQTDSLADACRRIAEIDDAIDTEIIEHQYPRYHAGEIDDPWDPAYDTDRVRTLRRQRVEAEDELFDRLDIDPEAMRDDPSNASAWHIMFDAMGTVTDLDADRLAIWAERVAGRIHSPSCAAFYLHRRRTATQAAQFDRPDRDPDRAVREAFEASYWRGPYGRDRRIANADQVQRIRLRDVQNFAAQHLRPENLLIVIVGDCDIDNAQQVIRSHFGTLSADRDNDPAHLPPLIGAAPTDPVHPAGAMAELRVGGYADVTPYILSRYRTVPHGHPDRPALDVVAEMLNGPDSRLGALLIDQHGVASTVSATHRTAQRAGVLDVQAAVAEKGLPEQLEMGVLMEVDRLRRSAADQATLTAARVRVLAAWHDGWGNPTTRAVRIGEFAALGDWRDVQTYARRIEAVTAADVQRVAQAYLDPIGRASLVVHAPPDPEFLALSPQLQNQVRAGLSRMLTGKTTPDEMTLMLDRLRSQSANAPEEVRPALAYMIRRIEARIEELNQRDADVDNE